MKTISRAFILSTLLASQYSLACGGNFKGKLDVVDSFAGQKLNCSYNGERSAGYLTWALPRCPKLTPLVTLEAFNTQLEVTKIKVKLIRGVLKHVNRLYIETTQTDLPVVCDVKKTYKLD